MTVNRWHSNPDARLRNSGDTITKHQQRVMRMCHSLSARLRMDMTQSDLLHAARHHDEAETILGDMPSPATQRFPALAAAYAKAELAVLTDMGLNWSLSRQEDAVLDICDKLDAFLWARSRGVHGAEWEHMLTRILHKAYALGPDATAWVEEEIAFVDKASRKV
jgi:5'-deoxynucleotidase YfbR-like HD superfamily hydrolase